MNKGFTLIELLVVVLIIGILAAIALPQYTKAVERSRAAEAWTAMSSLMTAERVYQLTEGKYTNQVGALDIEFKQKENAANTIATNSFDINLGNADNTATITITAIRQGGAYNGCGFSRTLNADGSMTDLVEAGSGDGCTAAFAIWSKGVLQQKTAGAAAAS